jgi:hypothetical protein
MHGNTGLDTGRSPCRQPRGNQRHHRKHTGARNQYSGIGLVHPAGRPHEREVGDVHAGEQQNEPHGGKDQLQRAARPCHPVNGRLK